MQEKKVYHSSEKQKILDKYIGVWNYGDYKPILDEIFQRRQYEFDISDEDFENEVRNFVRNVKRIAILPAQTVDGGCAMYFIGQFLIGLNEDYIVKELSDGSIIWDAEYLLEFLTHEVYHAITHYDDELGIAYRETHKKFKNVGLNEIMNEMAATRASIPITQEEIEKGRQNTVGYETHTPMGNLLALGCGMSVKELLKAGIKNREAFENAITSKFPNTSEEVISMFLRKIETSFDELHTAYMNMDTYRTNTALQSVFHICFQIASEQIQSNNREITSEYISEINHRYNRMEEMFQAYEKDMLFGDLQQLKETQASKGYLKKMIEGVNKVFKLKGVIKDQEAIDALVKFAKEGSLEEKRCYLVRTIWDKLSAIERKYL